MTRGKVPLEAGDEEGLRLENCIRSKIKGLAGNRFIIDSLYLECCEEVGIGPGSKWPSTPEALEELKRRPPPGEQENTGRNQFSKIQDVVGRYFLPSRQPSGMRRPVLAPRPLRLGF